MVIRKSKFPTTLKEYNDIPLYKYDKNTLQFLGEADTSTIKLFDSRSAVIVLNELSSDLLKYCDTNFYYSRYKLDKPITYETFLKYNIPGLWHFDGFNNGKLVYHHTQCPCNQFEVNDKDELPLYCGDNCYRLPKEFRVSKLDGLKSQSRRIYHLMLNRCYNKSDPGYAYYGAKGIFVCKFWLNNPWFFEKWYTKKYFHGCSIDRIDPRYEYAPYNCQIISKIDNIRKAYGDNRRSSEQLNIDKEEYEKRKEKWIEQMTHLGFDISELI